MGCLTTITATTGGISTLISIFSSDKRKRKTIFCDVQNDKIFFFFFLNNDKIVYRT